MTPGAPTAASKSRWRIYSFNCLAVALEQHRRASKTSCCSCGDEDSLKHMLVPFE